MVGSIVYSVVGSIVYSVVGRSEDLNFVYFRATIKDLYEQDFFVELEVKVMVINKLKDIKDTSEKNDQKYQLQIELHKVLQPIVNYSNLY